MVGSGDGSHCVRVGVVVEAIRVVQRGGVVVFDIVVPEMAVEVEWRPGGNPKDTSYPLMANDTIPHIGALYSPQHTTFPALPRDLKCIHKVIVPVTTTFPHKANAEVLCHVSLAFCCFFFH